MCRFRYVYQKYFMIRLLLTTTYLRCDYQSSTLGYMLTKIYPLIVGFIQNFGRENRFPNMGVINLEEIFDHIPFIAHALLEVA